MSRKIIGITVGTPLPKPNFKQTDPTKGDYIKNKPDFEGLKSRVTDVEEALQAVGTVKSVNGEMPDENGNVDIEVAQSDWNENDPQNPAYIQNRTHYEAAPTFDITWDGVIGDRFALPLAPLGYNDGDYFVKMDDRVFTLEELCGATYYAISGTESYSKVINAEDCDSYTFPGVFNISERVVVVYNQSQLNAAIGMPDGTVTNGLYFFTNVNINLYTSRFVGKDLSKKLDIKYLPDGYPYESEPKFNIIWDGNMDGRTALDMTALGFEGFYFAKVSDEVLDTEDLVGAGYYFNINAGDGDAGREIYDYVIDSTTYPGAHAINQEIVIVYDQSQLNTALGLPDGYLTNGTYFVASPTHQIYIARLTGKTEVHPIDGKYVDLSEAGLHTVATTGDYYSLNNRPTIYTDVVRYTSNQGLSWSQQAYARTNIDVYSKEEVDNKIENLNVDVDLSGYAKVEDVYSKTEVDTKINNLNGLKFSTHDTTWNYGGQICYGDKFVRVGDTGTYHSVNGIEWNAVSADEIETVCYGNGIYVGVGAYRADIETIGLFYSSDGIIWNIACRVSGQEACVIYTGEKFIAVPLGSDSVTVHTSSDGITWSSGVNVPSGTGVAMTYAFNKVFAQSSSHNWIYTLISDDQGATWSQTISDNSTWERYIRDMCYANGILVRVGYDRYGADLAYSTDLNAFHSIVLPYQSEQIVSVCYGKDKFVALSSEGIIFYSTDGMTWDFVMLPECQGVCSDVCYGDDKFVVVGYNKYFYSLDGVTWVSREIVQGGNNVTDELVSTLMPSILPEIDNKVNSVLTPSGINLIDQVTGAEYTICIREGTLVTFLTTLTDYNYTTNEDGTYTITEWNGTTKGKPSTEILIPNSSDIWI